MKDPLHDILSERFRQDTKWGKQHHTPAEWMLILQEEVGEAAKAILEKDQSHHQTEMIQVAAVALAALEDYYDNG